MSESEQTSCHLQEKDLIITLENSYHLTSAMLIEMIKKGAQQQCLESLTIARGALDDSVREALANCIVKNKLKSLYLGITFQNDDSFTQLLKDIKDHPTLKILNLTSCYIKDTSQKALCELITNLKSLKMLDITLHQLTDEQPVIDAMMKSKNLVKVEGLKQIPDALKKHLEQNKQFSQIEDCLTKWSKEELASENEAGQRKKTFYALIEKVKNEKADSHRLNACLASFYLQLAHFYQANDINKAMMYFNRVLKAPLKEMHCLAHHELGEMLYMATNEQPVDKGALELYPAFFHLFKAENLAKTQQEKASSSRLMQLCGIKFAEKILNFIDQEMREGGETYPYKRDYQRITG